MPKAQTNEENFERPEIPASIKNAPKGPRKRGYRAPKPLTLSIKAAVEAACAYDECHPEGLKGWLVERARSKIVADRQIFAALVAKVVPYTVQANIAPVTVNLGWLTTRRVEQDPGAFASQMIRPALQVIEHEEGIAEGRQVDDLTPLPPAAHDGAGDGYE